MVEVFQDCGVNQDQADCACLRARSGTMQAKWFDFGRLSSDAACAVFLACRPERAF
jgi:hypothetical protein